MISALILFLAFLLSPITTMAQEKPIPMPRGPSAIATPGWNLNQPASCSAVGPPPCPKCTITCKPGDRPVCTAGESASSPGSPEACLHPPACVCKR